MDKEVVFGSIGTILKYLGILMVVPLCVGVWYGEGILSPFSIMTWIVPLVITITAGVILEWIGTQGEIKRREGFAIVALGWLFVAIFGALPFVFSSTLGPIDAFFESMSGFSTTGATVMLNLEQVDRSILLWRSFTQWIGGMGVILLFIAIFPTFGISGSQLFDREFPGPMSERIRPRVQKTARMLWSIYLLLTCAEIIALFYIAKLPLYDSLCTAFSTMPTGGFSPLTENIGGYMNPLAELIIAVFMFLAGMNFILHYSLIRNPRRVIANKEFQVYCVFILIAVILITGDLYIHHFDSLREAFRYGGFQAISIMTTTGFTTANYDAWGDLSKMVIFALMFIGGCGGSTGGSIKVVRIYVLLKYSMQRIRHILYPHAIFVLKTGKKPISEDILQGIIAFFIAYVLIFVVCSILMAAMGLDIVSATSSVAASLGNVGPGFGFVFLNYAEVPALGKLILSFCMWAGRLELFTVLVLLTPAFWRV